MKKHFSIYKYYPLMALFVIAFQFLLIYLFDVGLWMIFCLVIYQIIASAYGVYSYCMLEEMNINKNYTKFNVFISSVSAIFAVPVSVFLLFPFFWQNSNFISAFNHIFNTNYYTSYEGGIMVFCLTCLSLKGVYEYTIGVKKEIKKIPNTYVKQIYHGMITSTIILIGFVIFLFLSLKDFECSNYKMDTQQDKEFRDTDYRLQREKEKAIQRAVDDYRRQWDE